MLKPFPFIFEFAENYSLFVGDVDQYITSLLFLSHFYSILFRTNLKRSQCGSFIVEITSELLDIHQNVNLYT